MTALDREEAVMAANPNAPDINLDTIVLAKGKHDLEDGEMCVMEASSVAAGEEFSDHPACVSPVIGAFLRSWNDTLPTDQRQQRQQLKPYIYSTLGTNTGPEDDDTRAWIACDWLVRTQTPAWLRLAGLTAQADLLAGMPELRPDTIPTIRPVLEAARKDANAARAAARAAAWDAAGDAAWDADWAAAWDAAGAAARERLAPTVTELQASAHLLIAKMCEVGR